MKIINFEFLARVDEIDTIYDDFSASHNAVIGLISDEEFVDHDKLRMSVDQAYYSVKSIKNDILLKNPVGTSLNESFEFGSQSFQLSARIPKLYIPPFQAIFEIGLAFSIYTILLFLKILVCLM